MQFFDSMVGSVEEDIGFGGRQGMRSMWQAMVPKGDQILKFAAAAAAAYVLMF